MSKRDFQIRVLMRNPSHQFRYYATGQLPEVTKLDSPLIQLLESIPPMKRGHIVGVTLSSDLGYHCNLKFHTASDLLHWLKPDEYVDAKARGPAESRRDRSFHRELTLEDLKKHTTFYPKDCL